MGIPLSRDTREARRLKRADMSIIGKRTFAGKTLIVRLHSIHDGDTFNVVTRLHKGESDALYPLRLAGIDTPELNPRRDTPHRELHKKAGHRVTEKLQAMYPPGTIFRVKFEREDSFNRLIGTIWEVRYKFGKLRDERNVCQHVLWCEWGLPYDGKKKTEFTREFLENIVSPQ